MNPQNAPQTNPKPVRACICYNTAFKALKAQIEVEGWTTVEEISRATGCGTGCGMCLPYLAEMLKTGETEFGVLGLPETLLASLKLHKS